MAISHAEKRRCIEREISQRERVYPRLVAAGKMREATALREIEVMKAVLEDYPEAQPDMFGDRAHG